MLGTAGVLVAAEPLLPRLPAGLPGRLFLADCDIFDSVDLADAATDFRLIVSESRSLVGGDDRAAAASEEGRGRFSIDGLDEPPDAGDKRSGVETEGLSPSAFWRAWTWGVAAWGVLIGLGCADFVKAFDAWNALGVEKGMATFCRRKDS